MTGEREIKDIIQELPVQPGIYQFLDAQGTIIYIGKAKNLKNRVSSYFNKGNNHGARTLLLVKKIRDIRFVVVNSEQDALLLENNLIKKYKPRYNVLLKDDKSYPWITITNEPFPRVFLTRRVIRDGSEYYGPYTSGKLAHFLIHLIKTLYPLRTCKMNIEPKNVYLNKYKVCLNYHIGNCAGPCVGLISSENYQDYIGQIRNILKGNISTVIRMLETKMKEAADALEFERAHQLKSSIEEMRLYQSKSTIVSTSIKNLDVFSFLDAGKYAYINYLRIIQGAVNQVHSVELERKLDETPDSLLSYAILEIRQLVNSTSREILVPFMPEDLLEGMHYSIPQRGEKKQLLELSERNANFFRMDREKRRGDIKKENPKLQILTAIKNELKLPALPHRIECFDNSNIQGTHPVASCVVFIDGKPAKKEYRYFHVKTVVGPDDFASMEEIVYRRYHRVLHEGKELPGLIVIDGGKGQLHAALNSLKRLDLAGKVPIVGLAKRMEEVYYPGDSQPYILGKNSAALKTLMQIRDEAHRFGITFHRKLREKDQIVSELSDIKGIGKQTEVTLLQHFKSVAEIKNAPRETIASVIGTHKAGIVYDYFHPAAESDI